MKTLPLSLSLPFARRLRRDQFVRFAHPKRLCVRAEHGVLWITIDGDPNDIELRPGESAIFDGPDRVLVGAIDQDAVMTATPLPTVPSWQDRLAATLGPLFGRQPEAVMIA